MRTLEVKGEYTIGPRTMIQFRSLPEPIPNRTYLLRCSPDYAMIVRVDTVNQAGLASGEIHASVTRPLTDKERRHRRAQAKRAEREVRELMARGIEAIAASHG